MTSATFVTPPVYPTTVCVDAVIEDFGVDVDAFAAEEGHPDPYGLVWGENIGDTSLGRLLWAAHSLLAMDLGSVEEMQGAWMHPDFHRALSGPGSPVVTGRLYDYVTQRVTLTVPGDRADAAAGMEGGTLWLYDLPTGIDAAAVLVHEARHRDGFDHVHCSGEPICDRDDSGAWGFELAVHELARDHSDDALARSLEQSWVDVLPERILWR